MIDTEEEIKPYKPLPKGSKFAKPNDYGQVANECLNFSFTGKHCVYFTDINDINSKLIETNCKVLGNCFCKRFQKGK